MTPDCSPCGYVVEMVRSCFVSRWRLFKDRPDLTTAGRFFRVPDNTPALPLFHYYFSRDYVSDFYEEPVELGETGVRRKYDKGVPPPGWNPPVVVGEPECIRTGETMLPPLASPEMPTHWDIETADRELVIGDVLPWFQEVCHPDPRSGLETLQQYLQQTIEPASAFAGMIGVICKIYDKDPTARDSLKLRLGEWLSESQVDPNDTELPGSAIVIGKHATICCVSGTTNPGQWIIQIHGTPGPMIVRTNYRTFPFWEVCGSLIFDRLKRTGDDGKKPILIAGHSLGGAAAAICAAKLLVENQQRDVRLLTYGSPKQGDRLLRVWLSDTPQLHMVNPADPVPYTPLDITYQDVFGPIAVPARWFQWCEYVPLPPTMWVDPSRNLIPVNPNNIPRAAIARYAVNVLTGEDPNPGIPHYATTYREVLQG